VSSGSSAPIASFTANNTNITVGSCVNFTSTSTNNPNSFDWQFPGSSQPTDTSQNVNGVCYFTPGCYAVTLTVSNAFGSDTFTDTCYINVSAAGGAPVASFTANNTNITAGSCVNFTNTSSNNPNSFNWQFPGSSQPTDTSQNVNGVCYNTPGCYAVTLTVSNAFGSDTYTDTCYINVSPAGIAPVAAFTANTTIITAGQSVNFSDLSTNNPTSWTWLFPGGSPGTSSLQNPNGIVYNTPGCYTVSLTAANANGSDTLTQSCFINVVPAGILSVTPAGPISLCAGDSITLTSNLPFGNFWNTGETTQSITVNSAGPYYISVTDSVSGTYYSNIVVVSVLSPPVPLSIGNDVSQCGGSVTLDATQPGVNYLWSNNDTSQSIVVNSSGNYSVTVSNSCGSETSNSINVNIQPVTNPAINITGSLLSICANDTVTFDATIINAGSAPTYQWMVNGSAVGNNTAIYSSATLQDGDVVNCMLTSNDTCASPQSVVSNALTLNVDSTLVPAISIASSATNVCTGTLVSFMASSTNAGASPTYQWKINGSNVGVNSAAFSSATLANGDVVSCQLLSSASCAVPNNANSNNISITVVTLPTPSFSIASNNLTTAPLTATFTNTTTNANNADFIWAFGDGSILADNSPSVNHTYANNGVYNVGLTIQDPALGCAISVFDPNNSAQTVICNVPGGGSCGFTPTTTPTGLTNACLGGSVLLSAANYPVGSLLQWNRNGIPLGGEVNPTFSAILPGFYTITATNVLGCAVTSAPVNVNFNLPAQTPPLITVAGGNGFCGQLNATLTASGNFASYVWSTGQTGNSINVTVAGSYFVTGQGAVGCDAVSLPVNIASSLVPTTEICMITVNPTNNFHTVVWEKPLSTDIDSFFVYKELPYNSSNYSKIASVDYDSLSEYEDIASNADLNPDRYKISVLDICGGESAPSNFVRSIHLQVAPGVGTDRFLSWSEYQGQSQNISSYLIYSGSSVANLSLLDSVTAPISYYVDDNPVAGLNTVYRVEAVLSSACVSTRTQFLRSSSNNAENNTVLNPDGIKEDVSNIITIKILPNPNNGNFEISLSQMPQEVTQWWIEDIAGRKITVPTQVISTKINCNENLSAGVYLFRINVGQRLIQQKIIVR
jgi:PKD repeat protein